VTSWSEGAISFVTGDDADSGGIVIARTDNQLAAGPMVRIVPTLSRLEASNPTINSELTLFGHSLGAQTGTVRIGGRPATILLWSRTSVLAQIPASLVPGSYPVTLTTASGAASAPLQLTVVPGSADSSAGFGSIGPSYDENHHFVKPVKPPSPVQLNLAAEPHQTNPGSQATLTVTLKLNGNPVDGATIKLSMLASPGTDYSFAQSSGTTDQHGVFKTTMHISKKPGDNIILAESGVFSDPDHVMGTGDVALDLSGGPLAWVAGVLPYAGLALVALLLLGVAAFINLRSMGLGRWI
jgi:hypothetical protein